MFKRIRKLLNNLLTMSEWKQGKFTPAYPDKCINIAFGANRGIFRFWQILAQIEVVRPTFDCKKLCGVVPGVVPGGSECL